MIVSSETHTHCSVKIKMSRSTPEEWHGAVLLIKARCFTFKMWFCSVTRQRQVWDWPDKSVLVCILYIYCLLCSTAFPVLYLACWGRKYSGQIVATAGSWQFTITLDIGGMKIRSVEIVTPRADPTQWQQVQRLHETALYSIQLWSILENQKSSFMILKREYAYHSVFISSSPRQSK